MRRQCTAMVVLSLIALPSTAHALELGVQDDGRTSTAVIQDVDALGGHWTRTIASVGQPGVAQRIRDAHTAGLKVILTVGGTGTQTRKPARKALMRYIASLPRADRYTVINEPDLSGMKPCTYRRLWMAARRLLGPRLLYGDFSPHAPLDYTAAVLKCGRLPVHLALALHPYQWTDPLAHGPDEGSIGNLAHIRRVMKGMGLTVDFWLDEFGYLNNITVGRARIVSDATAAWAWPRAIRQAQRNHAVVLIAYTAEGQSWDTRPGPLAWCSMTLGRACAGAKPPVHREPEKHAIRQLDPMTQQMFSYAAL